MVRKTFQLQNFCYRNGKKNPYLYLCCRDRRGNFFLFYTWHEKLRPRFYALREHADPAFKKYGVLDDYVVSHRPDDVDSIYHGLVERIETRFPGDVRSIRNLFPVVYEADIKWENVARRELGIERYFEVEMDDVMANHVPVESITPVGYPGWSVDDRVMVFDIETDSPEVREVPRYKDALDGLVDIKCIVTYDNYLDRIDIIRIGDEPFPESWFDNPLAAGQVERLGLEDRYQVEEHLFDNQRALLEAFVRHCARRRPDTYTGHNISGGNVLRGKHREWRNGFDFNIIFGCCIHHGVDTSRLSPVGIARLQEKGNKQEIRISGSLVADWLYWWKYSHKGDSLMKEEGGRIKKLRNDKLGSIASITLGIDKLKPSSGRLDAAGYDPFELEHMTVGGQYKLAPLYTTAYCMLDTMLVWFNEKAHGVIRDLSAIPRTAMGKPGDAIYAQKYTDDFTLHLAGDKYRLPTKTYTPSKENPGYDIYGHRLYQYRWTDKVRKSWGGYVPEVTPGFYTDVGCADFAKMYPSMTQTANEGIDTRIYGPRLSLRAGGLWIVDCRDGDPGYNQEIPWEFKWEDVSKLPIVKKGEIRDGEKWLAFFRQDFGSLEAEAYTLMRAERKVFQEKATLAKKTKGEFSQEYIMQNGTQKAYKYMTNARNGVKNNTGYRLSSPENYNAVVCGCSWLTMHLERWLKEAHGYDVVQGDTDSVFPKFKEKVSDKERLFLERVMNEEIERFVREEYHCKQNFMTIEFEKLFSTFNSLAKKKYIGSVTWEDGRWLDEPRLVYRGIELRRKSTSVYMDMAQYNICRMMGTSRRASADVVGYLRRLKDEFFDAPPSMIGTMAHIAKPVSEYNDIPRARAVRTASALTGKNFMIDEDFYMVYLEELPPSAPNTLRGNRPVIAVDDLTEHVIEEQGLKIDYRKHWDNLISTLDTLLEINNVKTNRIYNKYKGDGTPW